MSLASTRHKARHTRGKSKRHRRPTLAQARLRLASVTSPLPKAWSPEFETIIKTTSRPDRRDPGKPPVRFHGAQTRRARCLALLRKHHVPFRRARPHYGIAAPIVLTGPVGGIVFKNKWKPKEPPLMDCLLALTLQRSAPIWRRHGVRIVIFSNTYRKGRRGDPRPSRHALGLAMDVRDVLFKDGMLLNVEKDWEKFYGRPGRCVGPVRSAKAARLRAIICDLEAANVYRRVLTPDSDHGHRDHFHMAAAKPGERWGRERWAGRLLYQPLPGTKFFASWYHWYRCYKHLTWRGRKACWRRRRPGWVSSGNPHRFVPARLPAYLASVLPSLKHRLLAHKRQQDRKQKAHRPHETLSHRVTAAVPASVQEPAHGRGTAHPEKPANAKTGQGKDHKTAVTK